MSQPTPPPSNGADYYASGSAELATESALLLNKLSQRLALTKSDDRLVIVLVGLPGRGKSFISRKLQNLFQWKGTECKIFNVGKYRRKAEEGASADADFFDTKNESAQRLRQEVARLALEDMLDWIDEPFRNVDESKGRRRPPQNPLADLLAEESPAKGRVGIFDATNSTKERRDWILERCHGIERADKPTEVVFIESICNDPDIMRENLLVKISSSPDYDGIPTEEALADIQKRVQKYEEAYETIEDDDLSYIKLYNLSSKMMVNHIYGMLAKSVVPALMSWHMGTRPIYLCRAAAHVTQDKDETTLRNNRAPLVRRRTRETLVLSKKKSLDNVGQAFSEALHQFIRKECLDFKQRRVSVSKSPGGSVFNDPLLSNTDPANTHDVGDLNGPFPCHIVTSTLPSALETVAWANTRSSALSNFNPLDKGEFTGKDILPGTVAEQDAEWHERYLADPFHTRYPGGESRADLMLRLEPMAICLEQQVKPVLIVSHSSVLQALVAYFRNSPAESCMDIDLPLNTVFKFTPAKGGAWLETQHCILEE